MARVNFVAVGERGCGGSVGGVLPRGGWSEVLCEVVDGAVDVAVTADAIDDAVAWLAPSFPAGETKDQFVESGVGGPMMLGAGPKSKLNPVLMDGLGRGRSNVVSSVGAGLG